MSISVECQGCGGKFQAPEKFAGKRAKCPKCSAVIEVGARPLQPSGQVTSGEDSVQRIPVACGCGKKFRAKGELAGKRVKCPACGQALAIGHAGPAAGTASFAAGGTAPTAALDLDQLMAAEMAAATLPRALLGPSKKSKKRSDGSNTRLIVGLSVAAGVVVLVLVLVALLWPSGENAELAQQGTQPGTQPSEAVEAPLSPSPPPPGAADVPAAPSGQPAAAAPAKPAAARTYPSFPDAVTEVPPWNDAVPPAARDAVPPFDLAEFLKAPPAEENAAPLYLDALFEFEELSDCYVPRGLKWSQYPDEVKRRAEIARQRGKEHRRIYEAWDKDPKSVDMAAVDAWLADYDVGFQKLAAAQRRPRCVFQTGLSFDSLPGHPFAAREVARVVVWRTRRDLERGDFEQPIQGLKSVLRLSRDLRPRGDVVCQLVSIAVDGICCRQMVPAILTAPAVQAEHCDRLLALLAEHEAKVIDPFLEGNRAQYFIDRNILHDLQHRTGSFDPQHMREAFGIKGDVDSPLTCITLLNKLGAIGPLAREKYGALAGGSRPPGAAEPPALALLPGAFSGGKMLADDDYVKEVDALNRVYASILASILDLADRPNLRRTGDFETVIAPLRDPLRETTLAVFLAGLAEGAFMNGILRGEATLRGTQCVVALRRWQLQHEGLPQDLDTLVKAAGMPGVPIDPFSDQPLRMTVIGKDPVIYCVGPDGKDDKALVEWIGGSQPGDLIFRFEPPSGQEQIIAEIRKLGGTVQIEEWRPDRPVFGVSLAKTPVTDAALEHLKGLTGLRNLTLTDTKVTGAGLEHLKGLTNLGRLFLDRTQVTDAGLEHLKGLTSLYNLRLGGTQVSDAGLEHLKGLTNLGNLFLDRTQVSDAGLEHLKGLTSLRELDLSRTQVTDAGLVHLKGLTSLRDLRLANTQVTDAGLEHLKGLTSLKSLNLRGTQVTDAGVKELKKALPNSRRISR